MDDKIDAPWAEEGRDMIESALRDWNANDFIDEKSSIHIAWGATDSDRERLWESLPDGAAQFGLLSCGDNDFEIRISSYGDKLPPKFEIQKRLMFPSRLPLNAISLFNILEHVGRSGCRLLVWPNASDQSVFIAGLAMNFLAGGVTGSVIARFLLLLNSACEKLEFYLINGGGIDLWWEYFSDEDEDEETDPEE